MSTSAAATNSNGAPSGGGPVSKKSHEEEWMVNLGRGNDDAWLTGPRPEDWFTGLPPNKCPGFGQDGKLHSLPQVKTAGVTRQDIMDYFDNSWTITEVLFAGLKGEEYFFRPPVHGLRHPQIFYYGHSPCLYVNKLRVTGVLQDPVNAYFESIFEIGVDEMVWDDMHKNDMVWPTVSEVHQYRKQVYQVMKDLIMTHPSLEAPLTVTPQDPIWGLFMGFEHERIHMETSSVLFREAPSSLVQVPVHWPAFHPSGVNAEGTTPKRPNVGVHYPVNEMLSVEGGNVELGKSADFPSYAWDNSYGSKTVQVPSFMASKFKISNGEYWQFVASGGYRAKEFWCEDGWAWRTHRNLKWPFFWEPAGPAGSHQYNLRTIFETIPMVWNWPVCVTRYEAKAFCRWMTAKENPSNPYRLLTEAEHHLIRPKDHSLLAARENPDADRVLVKSGEEFAKEAEANLNLAFGAEAPIDFFPPSETGHYDTVGNAWELSEDHFGPLEGFEPHYAYDDYSTPCFDGKHYMLFGGSFASTGETASMFTRTYFRSHFLQHTGFRLVTSDHEAPATILEVAQQHKTGSTYETEALLNQYMLLHYPSSGRKEGVDAIVPHDNAPVQLLRFNQRVAQLLIRLKPNGLVSALDMGCAVGGASFELATKAQRVDAFDLSESFVSAAKKMKAGESVRFKVAMEGDVSVEISAVHEDGITPEVREKVKFFVGDACQLEDMQSSGGVSSYDGVIMSNLLCRLPDPLACLNSLPKVVNAGGVVLIVSPFSWREQDTPRKNWLGGINNPEAVESSARVEEIMKANGFRKIHEEQMPLLLREHRRKYQYIVSEATAWTK